MPTTTLALTSRRAAAVLAFVALTAPAAADARPVTVSYTTPGAIEAFTVPPHVTRLDVVAIGGSGGRAFNAPGGTGAKVTAQLDVTPGATLFVAVGENGGSFGANHAGGRGGEGWGLGGAGTTGRSPEGLFSLADGGGGGGGASAVVTCKPYTYRCSHRDTLLVAGAGGGGSSAARPGVPPARGGNGGTPNGTDGLAPGWGGGGAIGGTGGGGPAGTSSYIGGADADEGGHGADGFNAQDGEVGSGGGGGGWAGGGPGRTGGGGGGSSHAPAGATYELASEGGAPLPPSVTLTYDRLETTVKPALAGNAAPGTTLHASSGEWDATPERISYRWLRCAADRTNCVAVGSNSPDYTLGDDDLGKRLRVRVTAKDTDTGTSGTDWSTLTRVVGAPLKVARPTIAGRRLVGRTLTADEGEWNPGGDATFVWRRCDTEGKNCRPITGTPDADDGDSTYTLTPDDRGARISVGVTITNPYGTAAASTGSVLIG